MRFLHTIVTFLVGAFLLAAPVSFAQTKTPAKKTATKTSPAKKTATPQKKTTTATTSKSKAQTTKKQSTATSATKSKAQTSATQNAKRKTQNAPASATPTVTPNTQTPTKRLSRAEYEKQQQELIRQIAATERMISDNDKSVLSQSRDIKLREDEINKRLALLQSMQMEIESIRQEEDSLRRVVARLTREYKGKQDKYAAAVRHLYKWRSGYDEWLFILSAADVTESFRRIRYLRQYSRWREQEAHELARQRMATESVKEKLALKRAEREQLYAGMQKERDVLARKQQRQEESLAQLQKRQRELKSELARDRKRQRQIQQMITRLIAEERKKAEAARLAAERNAGKKGKTDAKTGQDSDKGRGNVYSPAEVQQLTGTFRQNKGKMPYPVDSNFAFLSHYSKDGNYSITLSTAVDAHACAIFDGTVQRVAKSSEDWTVIISHGDYMSVYSNLSACHVTEGQKVKMRQSIGKVKSDIDGKRAELMFWIFGKTDAENPELWLKR
jgi:murein hydrolase activator